MEWKDWSSVAFTERHCLPSSSGIYVVVDVNECVWYVGKASDIKSRWEGKTHHRYQQFIRSYKKHLYRIYWYEFSIDVLTEKEKYYIEILKPELNGCKVKKYLPQQLEVKREIKRLLKVLNKTTLLFSTVCSVVAGEYADDTIRCIVILAPSNDSSILLNSIHKNKSHRVQKFWSSYRTSI
ncbi:GIY-YIG nuclease family protein [Nostoc sp. FACHB-280]|uniref:GIY-YIG nuclease family protein n=1 Tax=Nostoc sp. FACHB-280 TaxID=2692839 RepID=UPI00168AB472|nr:hypothetical protein [Nostoc sp. FACHB-280]MBD2495764.1 hypothetical protein [Nostoc sp. FACHB-280]